MARYYRWITLCLFSLLLTGLIFAPGDVAGSSDSQGAQVELQPQAIHYRMSSLSPDRLEQLSFSLPDGIAALSQVFVKLTAEGPWYICSPISTTWSCPTPDAPALASVERLALRVSP